MYFCNWFRNLCYSLYFLLSSAYLHDIMIEFKGNKHFSLYTVYAKLQWVNTFMSMKHIHVKVYIKYIKIGGGGGGNTFWKVLSLSELIYCMKGRRRETNLTRDVFSPLWASAFCFLPSSTGMVLLLLGVSVAPLAVSSSSTDLLWPPLWSSFVKVGAAGIEDLTEYYIHEIHLVHICLRL